MTSTLSLAIGSITIGSDGSTAYELVTWDAGRNDPENKIAESTYVAGGALTSTRQRMTTMALTVRIHGTSLSDLQSKIAALAAAMSAFSYTIVETMGGSRTYTCLPASWQRAYDPILLAAYTDTLSFTVPRQPESTDGS